MPLLAMERLSLLLSLLAGPLYALSISSVNFSFHSTLCKLACAETPHLHWVVPCFVARHNTRARTGNCTVSELRARRGHK